MTVNKSSNTLQLYNTMAGEKQPFARRRETVKLFTCGPSIYAEPHIGNFRTFLYEDLLHRYLEYRGERVERLINFTDVEDKSIRQAGRSMTKLRAITEKAAENFFKNCGMLHLKMPDYIPRSSTSVDQVVKLISELLKKNIAYRHGSDIFYDPLKFAGFGRLFGLDMSSWPRKRRRYRRDTYEGNRWNRGDFILWHGYRPERDGDVFWETEFGRGRPAWNVQDAAMITKHMGSEIDIACGGVDNLYRHHDYNIAIIEGVSGGVFANFWLHGEHVLLDDKKMSKSKGNIIYPQSLLDRDTSAAAIRYCLGAVHYRRKLNLTKNLLAGCQAKCSKLQALARRFTGPLYRQTPENPAADAPIKALIREFESAMNDDLNTERAFETLLNRLEELCRHLDQKGLSKAQWQKVSGALRRIDSVLQVLFP